jgi:hypothetical protein
LSLNPNNIYKLDKNIKISKISSNIKGEFENNLTLKSNTILNDSFNIDVEVKNKNSNLEAKFENISFTSTSILKLSFKIVFDFKDKLKYKRRV